MVLFHLSYFVERHVALTEWVYTFHMSVFHGMYQAVCASFCFRCFGHAVGVGQHDTGCRSLSPNGASLRPNGAFRNSDGERFSPY